MVSQFLEQLEGGTYDAEEIRQQDSGGTSLGVGVHAGPLGADASRGRSSNTESELHLRQTGASRFSRFYELAMGDEEIQQLDGCDETIWDDLGIGEILDIGVSVSIPDIVKTMGIARRASSLMPMFSALSGFTGEDGEPIIDPDDVEITTSRLSVVEQAAAAMDEAGIPVISSLVGDNRFKVFVRLSRSSLQVEDIHELEGDARLVGTIMRKVPRGRPVEVGQLLPGVPTPSRAQRRQQGGRSTESNSISLRYPGAVVSPIAIFR